jgi:hypothetical protein
MDKIFSQEAYDRMIQELFCRFPSFQKVGAGAYKPGIGNMEFADIAYGIVGFLVMFAVFSIVRWIAAMILRLIRYMKEKTRR